MARKIEVEVTVPEGLKEGDVFKLQIEIPTVERKTRGQLNGLALEDMDDEQLKREIINAKSVLYKAIQREAPEETIAINRDRVDAAIAEKEKRAGSVVSTPLKLDELLGSLDEDDSAEMYEESTEM